MDIQVLINSKIGAYLSIAISRTLPPSLGYRFGQFIARLLSTFQNSNLIRSIRCNQWVIHEMGLSKKEQLEKSRAVLRHASRCYYDLYHSLSDQELIQSFVPRTPAIDDFIRKSQSMAGCLVVSPHLSNFDLVLAALAMYGFQARILTLENPRGAYEIQNKLRTSSGLDVTPLETAGVYQKTIDYLKAGGVAATAVDRPVPNRKPRHQIRFFGRPSALPVGHINLALAADVPIIVVAVKMAQDGSYHLLCSEPIHMDRLPNRIETVIHNAELVLTIIEDFIRQVPEQWLMYYPVWPQAIKEIT